MYPAVNLGTDLSQCDELGHYTSIRSVVFSQSYANLTIHLSYLSINQFLIYVSVGGFVVKFPCVYTLACY